MARIVIVGGSGHIGTYLVPALIERGHDVVNLSRGTAAPYRPHPAWKSVEQVLVDRKAEVAEGKFGSRIAGLNPDVVIDMLSFDLEGTRQLVEALRGKIDLYLFCSSILGVWTSNLGPIYGNRPYKRHRHIRDQQGKDRGLAFAAG